MLACFGASWNRVDTFPSSASSGGGSVLRADGPQLSAPINPPTASHPQDEPFHVPQTQRYCAGHWREWEPKITTFPGLYLFGTALGHAVHAAQRLLGIRPAALCGTAVLRATNLLFAAACLPLFLAAARQLDPSRSRQQAALLVSGAHALCPACHPPLQGMGPAHINQSSCPATSWQLNVRPGLAHRRPLLLLATAPLALRASPAPLQAAVCFLFPVHYFFSFLYYTDVPSLFFTLAAYLASRRRRYRLAAALGAAAVLVRQTNAVWVAFCLGDALLERCLPGSSGGSGRSRDSGAAGTTQRSSRNSSVSGGRSSGSSRKRSGVAGGGPGLASDLATLLRRAWLLKAQLASDLWPLAAVVAAFAAFVVANGGIVVGDKAHHAAVRHLAQPLYFLLYCTACLAPAFWSPPTLAAAARGVAAAARQRPAAAGAAAAAAAAAAVAAVSSGTLAHPFLLADNRHYAFYLWRRVLNRTPWARYALIPAYLYSGWALQRRLAHRGPLWLLLAAGGTCAVLVPAHLLEPRYFTTPFYLAFLHMRTPSPRALAAIAAGFAAVNAATLYLFLAAPFAWPDGSVARFMW